MQAYFRPWRPLPLACSLVLVLMEPAAMAQSSQQDLPGGSWFGSELRRYRTYSHLHQAYRLMKENRLEEAARELKRGLAVTPAHRETHVAYLQVLRRLNRAKEALNQANQYLALWPDDPGALIVRADAYERLGRRANAERDYELVYRNGRAASGERLLAARALADYALATGQPEKALNAIDTALQLQHTALLHLRRGQALAALQRYAEAEPAYARALSQAVKTGERRAALRGLADLAIVQNDMGKAVPHLRRMVELAPQDMNTRRQLVHAHFAQREYADAALVARRLADKSGDPSDAYLLGTVYAAGGEHAQAQSAYASAAQAKDTKLRVKALLAEGYSAQAAGNLAAARNAFEHAAQLQGGEAAARELAAAQPAAQSRPRVPAAESAAVRAQHLAEQGYVALSKKHASRATLLFEEALRLREQPLWRAQLAHVYRQQGDLVRLRDALAAIVRPSVDQMRELAAISLDLGEIQAGVQILGKIARTSDRAEDYLRLARAAAPNTEYTAVSLHAYRVTQAKMQQLPRTEQTALLAELGYVHLRSGEIESAYKLLNEAYAHAPGFPLAMELASLEERQNMAASARARLASLDTTGLTGQEKQFWYATRARLAQSAGDMDDALALLQRGVAEAPGASLHHQLGLTALAAGNTALAREHLDRARTLDPSNWSADMQLGYVCQSQNDLPCAIAAFERVADIHPGVASLPETLAYSYLQQGENERAVVWFKRAIEAIQTQQIATKRHVDYGRQDSGAAPETSVSTPQGGAEQGRELEVRSEALRHQIGDITRQWQLNGYQTVRNRGSQQGNVGIVGGGAVPSQGGLELQVRVPGLGYRDGRIVQLESRLLWSNRPRTLSIQSDTLQGTLGVAIKPFKSQDAFLRLEKLIKIGAQSQNNWLLHTSWGVADGWGFNPAKPHWNYSTFYVDAGVMLQHEKTRSLYLEGRQGRAFAIAHKTVLTPHVLLAGRRQNPDPGGVSYIEAGVGVSLKTHFNGSRYVTERSNVELALQYRKPIAHQAGGWVLTGAVQF